MSIYSPFPLRSHRWSSKRSEYAIWRNMRRRATQTTGDNATNYVLRGIGICDRWKLGDELSSGYDCFLDDMGPRPSPAHTVDRIDNDKGYSPDNCRWATWTEQHRNKRTTAYLEAFGRRQTLMAWAEELGLEPAAIRRRIARGWPIERVLTPLHFKKGGKTYPIGEAA